MDDKTKILCKLLVSETLLIVNKHYPINSEIIGEKIRDDVIKLLAGNGIIDSN